MLATNWFFIYLLDSLLSEFSAMRQKRLALFVKVVNLAWGPKMSNHHDDCFLFAILICTPVIDQQKT
jgi:hypothetical protein